MDIYVVIGYSICDNPYCSAIEEPFWTARKNRKKSNIFQEKRRQVKKSRQP